jgi:thiol:disulfide interchange protein DsbD
MQRREFLMIAAFLPGRALLPKPAQAQAAELAFTHVATRKELGAAVTRARGQKKPILVYFTAEWCPICKSIDRRVFSNSVIKARLGNIAVVRADVTAVDTGNRHLMESLGVPGPPTMLFLSPKNGREISNTRLTGVVDANLFLDTLNFAGF